MTGAAQHRNYQAAVHDHRLEPSGSRKHQVPRRCFPERIVVRLEFSESDADLDLFFELTNLENLYISEPDERILSRLGQFKKLRFLVPGLRPSFMGTDVGQIQLRTAGSHTSPTLRKSSVALEDGEFTDRGVAELRNLKNLEMLRITSHNITDGALQPTWQA